MLTRILRSRRFECRVEERDGPENMHPTVVEPLSERGFSSVSAFARAVQDWAETHHWALASMAKATILTHGAHDWTLSPPQMVMFMMDSVRPPSPSPARAFAVKNIMVVPVQDYLHKLGLGLSALQNWSRAQPVREMQERRYARTPGFLGLVPATFVADRMIATITFYPLFRPGADERRALARGGAGRTRARRGSRTSPSSARARSTRGCRCARWTRCGPRTRSCRASLSGTRGGGGSGGRSLRIGGSTGAGCIWGWTTR